MLKSDKDPEVIIKEKDLIQITDTTEIENAVKKILDENPSEVQQYIAGKDKVIGFFVGKVMQATKGKANPKAVNEILKKMLEQRR